MKSSTLVVGVGGQVVKYGSREGAEIAGRGVWSWGTGRGLDRYVFSISIGFARDPVAVAIHAFAVSGIAAIERGLA
jgi:hypothetical protein